MFVIVIAENSFFHFGLQARTLWLHLPGTARAADDQLVEASPYRYRGGYRVLAVNKVLAKLPRPQAEDGKDHLMKRCQWCRGHLCLFYLLSGCSTWWVLRNYKKTLAPRIIRKLICASGKFNSIFLTAPANMAKLGNTPRNESWPTGKHWSVDSFWAWSQIGVNRREYELRHNKAVPWTK